MRGDDKRNDTHDDPSEAVPRRAERDSKDHDRCRCGATSGGRAGRDGCAGGGRRVGDLDEGAEVEHAVGPTNRVSDDRGET
jgi:hypothetical protein